MNYFMFSTKANIKINMILSHLQRNCNRILNEGELKLYFLVTDI